MDQNPLYHTRNGKPISRRVFLRGAFVSAAGLFTLEMLGGFTFFFRPQKIGAFGQLVRAGKVEDFAVGSVTHFQEGKFYLSRVPEGFVAMWHKCTHLGCTVPWIPQEKSEDGLADKGRFNCPCHGSIYDRYGVVTAGPAPRPFDLFPVTIIDGVVMVDTDVNRVITRETWNPSQAATV